MAPKTRAASAEQSQDDGTNPPERPPAKARGTGGQGLVRLTVNLTKRSHDELVRLSEGTGLGKTDVVNRALQVYGLIEELLDKGDGRLTVVHADGRQERIYIL